MYALGSVLMALLGPVIMFMLMPAEYGLFNIAYSFINVLAACAGLGLRQVMGIEYFHADRAARIALINDIIAIYLLIATPFFVMLLASMHMINQYVFAQHANHLIIIVALAICFLRFFTEMLYQLLRIQCRAFELLCSQIISAACTMAVACVLLYYFQCGAAGALISYLVGMVMVVAHGLWRYQDKVGFDGLCVRSAANKMRYYLFLGFPFIPSILFDWILSSSDAWMLAQYVDMYSVGIYSAADNIGKLYPLLILYPMSGSYIPHLLHQFARSKPDLYSVEQRNKKTMWVSMIGMALCITLILWAARPLLYCSMPIKYHASIQYLWLIVIRYVFLMGVYFASTIIQFWKKTYFLAGALCVPALCNIALNYLLIPHFGCYGCAVGTLISYGIYFILIYGYSVILQRRAYA